ncbi:MAG TPA: succinate dehydrogenase iron-sulfur subunit [Anaerolineae bacterium]|nr:succinate dehydrogenase iron-sulfur subunit [Anaerolineae bacterium]
MQTTLRILRFNPETDRRPHWAEFTVEVEPTDRLLDALNQVKDTQDGTLTYRRSCAHGVCGSDAMTIDSGNRLACKTLMRDLGRRVTIEPLRGFKVIKDLVVDMDSFFDKYRLVMPYLINVGEPPPEERLQSQAERARFDMTTKCILCGCCTGACPSYWANPDYIGPAAIVQAHRFLFDSRDQGLWARLQVLNTQDGVWRCRTVFNCTLACPREIEVTKAIGEVKRLLVRSHL